MNRINRILWQNTFSGLNLKAAYLDMSLNLPQRVVLKPIMQLLLQSLFQLDQICLQQC